MSNNISGEIKYCLLCEKELKPMPGKVRVNGKRKFCDKKCRTRYFSIKRYYKIRNSPTYKAKRKAYFRKWVEVNRTHFNELMREPSRNYQRKKTAQNTKNNKNGRKSKNKQNVESNSVNRTTNIQEGSQLIKRIERSAVTTNLPPETIFKRDLKKFMLKNKGGKLDGS